MVRAVLLGCVVVLHLAVWAWALQTDPGLVPLRQLVAEGLSTFAVVLMTLNLVLATRIRVLERYLDGLDKLFVTHRLAGLSIAALVTTHFVLVPKSAGFIASKPVGYPMLPLLLLAILMASAPRFPWRRLVPIRYQTWKSLHKFQGLFVAAAIAHSLLAPSYARRVPVLAIYVYGVAVLGLVAWGYRETAFAALGPIRSYTVRESRRAADDVLDVSLAPSSEEIDGVAGQFVFVSFADGPTPEQHPFTISSGAGHDLRVSIKAAGDFTDAMMSGVGVGSGARIEGPYGRFDYRKGRRCQLWLAGGIGITPFLAMATDLDATRDIKLVWSVRTAGEAAYAEELARLDEENPGFTATVHPASTLGHLQIATIAPIAEIRDCESVDFCR